MTRAERAVAGIVAARDRVDSRLRRLRPLLRTKEEPPESLKRRVGALAETLDLLNSSLYHAMSGGWDTARGLMARASRMAELSGLHTVTGAVTRARRGLLGAP